jgi:hypothetical protein
VPAGASKILFELPLLYFILAKYAVASILTVVAKEAITAVSWDSAGVTTGPGKAQGALQQAVATVFGGSCCICITHSGGQGGHQCVGLCWRHHRIRAPHENTFCCGGVCICILHSHCCGCPTMQTGAVTKDSASILMGPGGPWALWRSSVNAA